MSDVPTDYNLVATRMTASNLLKETLSFHLFGANRTNLGGSLSSRYQLLTVALKVAQLFGFAVVICLCVVGCAGKSSDELVASAKDYLAKKNLNAGIIELKNALQKTPDMGEARFLLGKALLDGNDFSGAEVELRKARELKYPEDQVLPLLADALIKTGKFQKVLELDSSVALTLPEAIAAIKTAVARAYAGLGDSVKAEAAVTAALQAKADYSPALMLRARRLASKNDFDSATKIINEVLAKASEDPSALTLKGDIAYERRDVDAAAALYRKVIAGNPADIPANEGLLILLLDKNDFNGTRAQLDALNRALPGHPLLTFFRARLAFQTGDLRAAEELVQELLRLAPDNPHALMLAGEIALQRSQWLVAQQHLGKLVSQSPNAPIARQMLARAYLRGGDSPRALEVLDPLMQVQNPDAQTLALAASARLLAGDFEAAQRLYGRAAKLDPEAKLNRSGGALARIMGGDAKGLRELQAFASEDRATNMDLTLISVLMSRRDYDGALNAIDKLEAKSPGKPLAPHLRGQTLMLRGDLIGARTSFEKALAADPRYFPSVDRLAVLDWREKKPDAARERFRAVLQTNPEDVRAMVGLANLEEQVGKPKQEVIALLTKAASTKPTDPSLRSRLIRYLLNKEDYKLALNAAQAAVSALPNEPEMLALLAKTQLAAGDFNQAISSYGALASLQPKSPDPLLGLSEAHLASKSFDAATEAARKATMLAPNSPIVTAQAARVDMLSGRPEAALARAHALQARSPKSADGFTIEGDLQYARDKWEAAAIAYRAALLREPDGAALAQRLYLALRASGNQAKADSFAMDWFKTHPKEPRFPFFLARMSIQDKKYDSAEFHLRQVLSLDPENATAVNNLAWVLQAQKKPGALELAERANQLAPNQSLFMDTLAVILADQGQLQRALQIQKRAVELSPGDASLRLALARLYVKSGQKKEARSELNDLAKLGDRFSRQSEVLDLLAKL